MYKTFFRFETVPLDKNKGLLVFNKGSVFKKDGIPNISRMIYMPKSLSDFIVENTAGKFSPTVVALIEYSINALQEQEISLVSSN